MVHQGTLCQTMVHSLAARSLKNSKINGNLPIPHQVQHIQSQTAWLRELFKPLNSRRKLKRVVKTHTLESKRIEHVQIQTPVYHLPKDFSEERFEQDYLHSMNPSNRFQMMTTVYNEDQLQ